jgi:lysophospholipid acyltransferase (LPLAT)-like uncharacterized protein
VLANRGGVPPLHNVWFELGACVAAIVAPTTLRSIIGTCRVRVDDGGLLERSRRGEAFIGAMWHEDIGFFADYFRGTHFTVLVSRSRDGEIAARVVHRLRLRTVRGSSSRGGEDALQQMIDLAQRGECIGFLADGPRGPPHVAKLGPVVAAKLSGRPIVPIACAMRGAIRVNSWDRTRIPLPFARIIVRGGEPITVPRSASRAECARVRQQLQDEMLRLGALAAAELLPSGREARATTTVAPGPASGGERP